MTKLEFETRTYYINIFKRDNGHMVCSKPVYDSFHAAHIDGCRFSDYFTTTKITLTESKKE